MTTSYFCRMAAPAIAAPGGCVKATLAIKRSSDVARNSRPKLLGPSCVWLM